MNDYIWTPSGTDITERWRRMGWVPPSEKPEFQQKWSSYRELPLRSLTEAERDAVQMLMTNNVVQYTGGRR